MPDPRDPVDGRDIVPTEQDGVPVPAEWDDPPNNPDETEDEQDMPDGVPEDPPEY